MYQELEKRNLRQLRRELVSNKKEGNKTIYQNAVCKFFPLLDDKQKFLVILCLSNINT